MLFDRHQNLLGVVVLLVNATDSMRVLADIDQHMQLDLVDITDDFRPHTMSSICLNRYTTCDLSSLNVDLASESPLFANQWINRKYVCPLSDLLVCFFLICG
jgi:hypothetical protein